MRIARPYEKPMLWAAHGDQIARPLQRLALDQPTMAMASVGAVGASVTWLWSKCDLAAEAVRELCLVCNSDRAGQWSQCWSAWLGSRDP